MNGQRPADVSGFCSDLMTDWTAVVLANEEAASVALWAFMERQRTPGWRWFRRRFLDRVFEEKGAEHDRLSAAIERARSRGVDVGGD